MTMRSTHKQQLETSISLSEQKSVELEKKIQELGLLHREKENSIKATYEQRLLELKSTHKDEIARKVETFNSQVSAKTLEVKHDIESKLKLAEDELYRQQKDSSKEKEMLLSKHSSEIQSLQKQWHENVHKETMSLRRELEDE